MADQPNIPQKSPHVLDLEPGRYAWCACGRSAKDPFCDGSHKGSEFRPVIFELDEARRVALCGCKHCDGDGPYCDGSHKKL